MHIIHYLKFISLYGWLYKPSWMWAICTHRITILTAGPLFFWKEPPLRIFWLRAWVSWRYIKSHCYEHATKIKGIPLNHINPLQRYLVPMKLPDLGHVTNAQVLYFVMEATVLNDKSVWWIFHTNRMKRKAKSAGTVFCMSKSGSCFETMS